MERTATLLNEISIVSGDLTIKDNFDFVEHYVNFISMRGGSPNDKDRFEIRYNKESNNIEWYCVDNKTWYSYIQVGDNGPAVQIAINEAYSKYINSIKTYLSGLNDLIRFKPYQNDGMNKEIEKFKKRLED